MMKKTYLASAATALMLIASPASAATFVFTGTGGAINDFQTLSSLINVPNDFVLTDVNVTLNGLSHSYWNDLELSLTHAGTVVNLSSNNGGSSNPNGAFTFDDQAATSVTSVNTSGGTFRPESPLSAFNGTSSAGSWMLKVYDDALFDSGSLQSWSVQLTGNVGAVPEPATWAMMITGFGFVGAAMRRRRAKVMVNYA